MISVKNKSSYIIPRSPLLLLWASKTALKYFDNLVLCEQQVPNRTAFQAPVLFEKDKSHFG